MSSFKVGDRVILPGKLVSYPGETETTIKTIYRVDGGHGAHELYELADSSYRRFDELQHTPAQPGRDPDDGRREVSERVADYRDGEVTLVIANDPQGLRIGMHALGPWYATGICIPQTHPAYYAALAFHAALASSQQDGQK